MCYFGPKSLKGVDFEQKKQVNRVWNKCTLIVYTAQGQR